jgi:glycosyltransferase involved in cell wall biosynthesis
VGGKERQAVELIKGLVRSETIDCAVVCLERDDFYLHELTSAGLTVEFVLRRHRWDPSVLRKLYGFVKSYKPDIIHTNGLMSSFYALPAAKLLRIPLINGSIRNAFASGDLRWTLEKMLLYSSDYRVANSYAGLRSRGLSERDGRNVVIYNGFDFTRLESLAPDCTAARIRKEATETTPMPMMTVGMVAEFNRFKDHLTFIQMARRLTARRKDVVFALVGDGQTLGESRKAAKGVEGIRFLGKQKHVEPIAATFHVGVLCTFVEGLSNSIMEYMALGLPVVATDGGGTRELVADGETGFLVPPGDPDALAARIEYLLDHPAVAHRMGEAGKERLRQGFSITRMVEDTLRLYNLASAGSRRVALRDGVRSGTVGS